MSKQIKAKSGGAGVPTYTNGCSQSSATHTVYPLLAGSLIGAEEDPNSLKRGRMKLVIIFTH
jgi:hypothetical protein